MSEHVLLPDVAAVKITVHLLRYSATPGGWGPGGELPEPPMVQPGSLLNKT